MYNKRPTGAKISQLIYHYIREQRAVSKQGIVVGLNLSLPTITQNLQYLISLGLIDTSNKIRNTGGRSATAYAFVKRARVAIGVYLSAHHISVIGVDLSGEIIAMEKTRMKFDLDNDAYVRELGDLVERVKIATRVSDENLLGVGIAVQGLVSDDGEEVTYGKTLDFTGITRAQIAKYIPYPNRLFHDSEVGGYAEVWVHHEVQDAFYISLSSSIGGAVVMNNELHLGDTRKSGEIGHVVAVAKGGEQCYCGKYGCFETVCRATKLSDYTDGNLELFFDLLKQGDEVALKLWDEFLDHLASAIHNIRMLFNGTIILGGYVGSYIGAFIDDLRARVDARNPFSERAKDYLIQCKYKIEASAAGAAISYIDKFFESI